MNGSTSRSKVFIAVHLGAGSDSKSKRDVYEDLCNRACQKGLKMLKAGKSADEAVVETMTTLENSKLVNAGKGSNLTVNETVECDAGFMSGSGRFGGIGAVPGLPNPCRAAKMLTGLSPEVLIPPNLIVGDAARSWAASQGLNTCPPSEMICKRSKRMYAKYIRTKDEVTNNDLVKACGSDTLGVVAIDKQGHVAAAGSTGGGLYKLPGRVGPVAQYGCGVYARDATCQDSLKTAFAATGTGEFLTELRLAAACDNSIRLKCDDPARGITDLFDSCIAGKHVMNCESKTPIVGVIGLAFGSRRGEFIVCHNSETMIYAFCESKSRNAQVHFSTKQKGSAYKLDVFGL